MTPRHRYTTGLLAILTSFGLSACLVNSPVTTDLEYDPAEGVSLETSAIKINDLLVISEGDGAPGVVSGYAVNTATPGQAPTPQGPPADVTVRVALDLNGERVDLEPEVTIAAEGATRLDSRDDTGEFLDPVMIGSVPASPGELVTLRVRDSTGEVVSRQVPVLTPERVYADYGDVLDSVTVTNDGPTEE